jgi:hypothetical protein
MWTAATQAVDAALRDEGAQLGGGDVEIIRHSTKSSGYALPEKGAGKARLSAVGKQKSEPARSTVRHSGKRRGGGTTPRAATAMMTLRQGRGGAVASTHTGNRQSSTTPRAVAVQQFGGRMVRSVDHD